MILFILSSLIVSLKNSIIMFFMSLQNPLQMSPLSSSEEGATETSLLVSCHQHISRSQYIMYNRTNESPYSRIELTMLQSRSTQMDWSPLQAFRLFVRNTTVRRPWSRPANLVFDTRDSSRAFVKSYSVALMIFAAI